MLEEEFGASVDCFAGIWQRHEPFGGFRPDQLSVPIQSEPLRDIVEGFWCVVTSHKPRRLASERKKDARN